MTSPFDTLFNQGARWLRDADLAASAFSTKPSPTSLLIGQFGANRLYFDGNESLTTIGAPGTAKSMAQVVPNLLAYPGSVFVLDVKGELFEQTAGYRQRFGKVIKFAPTDSSGRSHAYNIFDLIPKDPAEAQREARIMATMLIPEQPNARERFWSDKAREYAEAFILLVAYYSDPDWRNLGSVSDLLAIRTKFEKLRGYMGSWTQKVIEALEDLGSQIHIPALARVASAFYNGLDSEQNTLESIFDTARASINGITGSPTAQNAMRHSDWHPLDLRTKPGTSVYICLKPDEIKAFAPLVRIIFQQHVSQLIRSFHRSKQPPITFFLDEMPQLGNMPMLPDIIEVGRGAGLRLWMFMQMTSQMREAYGDKALGLIESCKVRCYMSPDNEAAKDLSFSLGDTLNPFTGEKEPLVKSHEFAGAAMRDDIITLARGSHPARLQKVFAFKDPVFKSRMGLPLPPVPLTSSLHTPTSTPPASQPPAQPTAKTGAAHVQPRPHAAADRPPQPDIGKGSPKPPHTPPSGVQAASPAQPGAPSTPPYRVQPTRFAVRGRHET